MGDINKAANGLSVHMQHLSNQQVLCPRQRIVITLAGAPGAGKTSLYIALLQSLDEIEIRDVLFVRKEGHDCKSNENSVS